MQITRTRTKYYVLSVLGALAVAVGVLALAPSAQAQPEENCDRSEFREARVCIDKKVSPNPVTVGEPLTFTIDVSFEAEDGSTSVFIQDPLPPGVEFVSVSPEFGDAGGCFLDPDRTIQCRIDLDANETQQVTINVIPRECGTFTNTAIDPIGFRGIPIEDPEEFTVVGCEGSPAPGQQQPSPQQQPGGGAGGGGASPITQEGEQESEAGEIDQSFDVS